MCVSFLDRVQVGTSRSARLVPSASSRDFFVDDETRSSRRTPLSGSSSGGGGRECGTSGVFLLGLVPAAVPPDLLSAAEDRRIFVRSSSRPQGRETSLARDSRERAIAFPENPDIANAAAVVPSWFNVHCGGGGADGKPRSELMFKHDSTRRGTLSRSNNNVMIRRESE